MMEKKWKQEVGKNKNKEEVLVEEKEDENLEENEDKGGEEGERGGRGTVCMKKRRGRRRKRRKDDLMTRWGVGEYA